MEQPNRLPKFRERLNELMGERSATQFAADLEMSRQTIGFYLNGNRIPDAETLKQICEKCNVSADWLLGLSSVMSTNTELKAACGYTGLSEVAISVLNEESCRNTHDTVDCVNYLLLQEEPSPYDRNPEYLFYNSEGEEIPRSVLYEEKRWENKKLHPILSLIWDYIRGTKVNDRLLIDAHGNIKVFKESSSCLEQYRGMSIDGLRLVDGQQIVDQVLLHEITEVIIKLRNRYQSNQVDNSVKEG